MEKLGIIGCGWLGKKIAKSASEFYEISTTTTSAEKLIDLKNQNFNPYLVKFSDNENLDYKNLFSECDIIIITIPFSQRTPIPILEERFKNIIKFIGDFKGQLFICSSTGIYPQLDKIVSENSIPENLLNQNISTIEKLMKSTFPQINILRFGGLMGEDRYFSKYYQNKEIAEPNQVVNHTHYEDICEVFLKLIKLKIKGETLNVVSPEHPTKIEVFNCQTKNNCEENDAKKSGKRVSPERLIQKINYKFLHPDPAKF
jgi:nucleoside-diphosphate-sugar epimerase